MCDRIGFNKDTHCSPNTFEVNSKFNNTNFAVCCKIEKLKNFYIELKQLQDNLELKSKIMNDQPKDVNNGGIWINSSDSGLSCNTVCENEEYHRENGDIGKMSCKNKALVSNSNLDPSTSIHINNLDNVTKLYDNVNLGIYAAGNKEYAIRGDEIDCSAFSTPEHGVVTNICPCYRPDVTSEYTNNDLSNIETQIVSKKSEISELLEEIKYDNAYHKQVLLEYMGENPDSKATFGLENESLFDGSSEGIPFRLVDWIKTHVSDEGLFTEARNKIKNLILKHDSSKALYEKTNLQLSQTNTEIMIWGTFSFVFFILLRSLVKKHVLKSN